MENGYSEKCLTSSDFNRNSSLFTARAYKGARILPFINTGFFPSMIISGEMLRMSTQVYKQLYDKHPLELVSWAKASSFSE